MKWPLLVFVGLATAACARAPAPPTTSEQAACGTAAPDAGPAGTSGSSSAAAPVAVDSGLLPDAPSGWTPFAARGPATPRTSSTSADGGYLLSIDGAGIASEYGGWTAHVSNLAGSSWYRFTARATANGVSSLREAVTIVLRWSGSFGEEVEPDYVWDFTRDPDGSLAFDRTVQSPPGTTALDVQLILQWAPQGDVAFTGLSLQPAPAPASRSVRVAAVSFRPTGSTSGLDSVQKMADYAGQVAAAQHPDLIVLGEMANVVGAPGDIESNAEPIPGPSSDAVAAVARANQVNIVVGLAERDGDRLYNSAIFIDRSGNILAKYHKVQLPLPEASAGVSPGDGVPVVDADFGKVALLICQDTSFPEPAREAALQGAELLAVPIWGGRTALVHARAIENGIPLAASGYDYASEVVDGLGNPLAAVSSPGLTGAAVADVPLGGHVRQDYLGDWHDIANKERRAKPYTYVIP